MFFRLGHLWRHYWSWWSSRRLSSLMSEWNGVRWLVGKLNRLLIGRGHGRRNRRHDWLRRRRQCNIGGWGRHGVVFGWVAWVWNLFENLHFHCLLLPDFISMFFIENAGFCSLLTIIWVTSSSKNIRIITNEPNWGDDLSVKSRITIELIGT